MASRAEEVAMLISRKLMAFSLALALGICILGLDIGNSSHTRGKNDIEGWGKNSTYDKLYDPAEWQKIKGFVVDFKTVTPLSGMSPGVAMLVRDKENKVVTVHLGPRSFIHLSNIKIRKGDRVKVKGVWAEIHNEDVFIASKVKTEKSYVLKVRRSKDGAPYWTLSYEELAKERSLE
jgi:hypothetical protein